MTGAGKGWRAQLTNCKRGHLLTGQRRNTRKDRNGKVYFMRYCMFCERARKKKSGRGEAWRRAAQRCPKGHPYEGANLGLQTVREHGKERETRLCVACRRESQRAYKARLLGRPVFARAA